MELSKAKQQLLQNLDLDDLINQGSWTAVLDPEAEKKALRLCRGKYQRELVMGRESLSGSTLKGKAAKWSGRYYRSRCALMERLQKAGVGREAIAPSGRRVLVIG